MGDCRGHESAEVLDLNSEEVVFNVWSIGRLVRCVKDEIGPKGCCPHKQGSHKATYQTRGSGTISYT